MDKIIPTVGETGFYRLKPPFELELDSVYTCKSVTQLSEFISLGRDPFVEFYEPKGLDKDTFEAHLALDIEIISLANDGNHWVHVPSSHLLGYPNMNGIPYRGMALAIALPPLPAEQDFTPAFIQLRDTIKETLGVECEITPIETTKLKLLDSDKHKFEQAQRQAAASGTTSISRALYWQRAYEDLKVKYDALVEHFVP